MKPILDVSARIETMASVRCQCAGALHAIYISQDFKSATLATRAGIFYAKEIQVLKTKANSWWQRLLLLLKTPHKSLKLWNWNLSKKKYNFFSQFFDIDMRARCELMMNVIILKAKFLLKLCQMPWLPPTSDFQSYCNETFHPIWLFSTISQDLGILFSVSFSMFIPTMWCFLSWIAALLFIRSYHRVNKTARNLPLLNLLSLVWTTWDGLK